MSRRGGGRSGHIAPHRWVDLARGRVGADRAAAWERHAAGCDACAQARRRALAAAGDLAAAREVEAPELGWDHIGARVYWVTSSERRGRPGRGLASRWRWGIAAAVAAAAAIAFALSGSLVGSRAPGARASAARGPALSRPAAAQPVAAVAPPLRGVVTYRQGQVTVDGVPLAADTMDRPLGEGARIVTGAGRVAVQFGAGSGLSVGPHSVATLRSFNQRSVRIDIQGRIDVEVSHRAPDQTFAVFAGRYAVRVRGTIFRVDRRGASLKVICTRGRVVVDRGDRAVAVPAGRQLRIWQDAIDSAAAQPLEPGELGALDRSIAVPMLPAWTDARSALATSAVLTVNAAAETPVDVDGVDVGRGELAVRMLSGRHYVGGAGDRPGRWVDLAPGNRRVAVAGDVDAVGGGAGAVGGGAGAVGGGAGAALGDAKANRGGGRSERRAARQQADLGRAQAQGRRKAELDAALDGNPAVARCMRPLDKQGLAEGSVVVFDIGINADGSEGHVNLVKSNVPAVVARCLRHAVDAVAFKPGPAATIRARLSF